MALMIDNSRRRGFTLVEIIIVIAVMTIIAALAYPNFQGFMASRRLNGAARQVQGDLLAARMRAVSENREIKVKFINGNQYTMFYDYNNNGQVDTGEAIET
ncbi:MAG TPA: GspH/FimT family pseudopilin, partial [Syntrophales bacterium]|nr:GspH/FimT family pseudopilin [Syntrophales bacterium]HQG33885.1 GspH/FimT family pseudopilin [Syntrophales bacterium]HRR46829.1 GspH/FimT family pseudopilin [Syntrophales bacterium]